jgi:tetratricopeptide (TPR) repeat protein
MNFTTQAAQDVLSKIEREPAEIRHWRQLLILCFDQKSVDTLQTLQVVVAAIEQIWSQRKHKAKEAHDAARQKQRATGSKDPLPSLSVLSITLSARQKETFSKLAANPQSVPLLYRFGLHLEEDFMLPEVACTIYERAKALDTDETHLEEKILAALKRLNVPQRESNPAGDTAASLAAIAPESMGVKSPTHHRPSAAALIKRTGRLSVDRSRIQVAAANTPTEVPWPETQKKLDEMMSKLLAQAAAVCETAPRPMRLPRSIAPSQWLEFLEGHVTLLLATLEAQDIAVETSVNLEQAPRDDVTLRADLVFALMEEIERTLSAMAPSPAIPARKTVPLPTRPSDKPIVRLEDIFEWIEAGSLSEAEKHLRQLEDESLPKEQLSEVWFHLGLAFQNNQESKRAVAAYQRACELNPQNIQAWFNGGMIQHEEGMLRPAMDCYRTALEIEPEQPKIWCNLGALQFQMGEFDQSVESLNRAVELKPDYARAWDNLAGSLCAVERMEEAEHCCLQALEHKPHYADAAFKLGAICFQQDRLEEAEDAFRKVLEWQPGFPLAGHYLAIILSRTERLDEALEVCEKAAAPPGEAELPTLAWTEMAFHLYDKGDFGEAIRCYEKALVFTPERPVIWLDAGVAYHQMGELDEARRHYEQAVTLDPELARAWHNLGAVLEEMGDEEGGKKALEEAERLLAR